METRRNGEAAGSYESRNDLALRSAASDPAAEPQYNPSNTQGPKSSHAKQNSKVELEAAQSNPESNAQGLKSKHYRKISVDGPKARQPQSKDAPDSQVVKENATPSNSTANQAMTTSLPDFVVRRNKLFDKFKRQRHAEILEKEKPEINVVLDLGLDKQGKSRAAMPVAAKAWESTPGSFLKHLDKDFSSDIVIAKVDGKELWDLDRPLEYGCRVSYVPFSSTEGRNVFWHSCAHVLGEACECQFNCLLSHGPPVEQGFFYDMAIAEGQVVKEVDWAPLEKKAAQFFKEKQPFERLHVSIPDLKEMFGYSKYKMYYIENLLPSEGSTVYKCGSLVDLCLGPHIQNTGKIKAFQIMKNSSCYFRGDKNDDSLQRIYGVAFPEKKQMTAHKKFLEEASKRDHRKIGAEQELFFFDDVSPGNAFFLPHGTIIFNALQKLLRSEYQKRGYQEVQTPNMYDVDLWKISGHWQHYRDDMFSLEVEKKKWALKPMNCPGHCIIFGHRERSYRELPLRMADFGVLHRNEASGALNGMTRVRRFQQDDTHIFCTQDQITQEIEGLFDFLKCIYGLFGFPFKLELSTRPEKYLGDLETWEIAESKLKEALDEFTASGGGQWELNEGDGAFYGPKIDIGISDALKREFQCATIQLDFQLPQNFELEYMTAETGSKPKATESVDAKPDNAAGSSSKPKAPGPGRARPVMIHRAIVGSFERFIAIMTEHFAGKWPFWLSPRQVLVIPVMPTVNDYVEEVQHLLRAQKMHADIDISGNTMKKKILTGQLAQYNFIFVVGAQEKESRSVNIRNRDDQETQSKGELIPLDEAMRKLKALRKERRLINSIYGMAQRQVGATDFALGAPHSLSHSNLHSQSVHLDDNAMVGHSGSSTIGESETHHATSTMSQSHPLTPSRGGTLKKRQSLSRKNSLKRSGSRRDSRPGSVKGLTFADDVAGNGSEMNSAFFTPVPTTGSPTEILANRFQVWRKVLKDLIIYFRDIQKSYDARSKSLFTISNVITNITTPTQFVSEGGISDAIYALRNFHKQAITEGNKAKSIEEDVIVQLTGLRSDLGQKIKEIKGLSGDFKNGVDKETEGTRRAVRDLQDALGAANTDAKNDPFLVRLGVDRQLGRQIEEENYLHRAFLNLESSGRELESIVMGEVQKAYSAYAGIIKREADEAYEAVERLRNGPLAIPKDFEWNAFVDNNEHFVDPRLPVRRVENIAYPGKDDAAASEVKAGMLERKSKYLKSYTPGWYVLSTTHLHEFKSPDRISSQAPMMSLPLADQKLGSHSNVDSTSHKFMLKGRQSGGMHRGHAWVFRAESYDTMLAWFSDIKDLTEKTGAERKEFIRRSHARSVSAGSHKPGSISSDGGIDEDEADEVPYSATASQADIPPKTEMLPQRPIPGGRFPSALKINRDSQVPVSSSSPSSSTGDREIIAAAGALPGSGIPFGSSGQQVQAGDDEKIAARGELDGVSAAPMVTNSYSPIASKQGLKGVPLQKGSSSAAEVSAKNRDSSEQARSSGSLDDPGFVAHHQQQVDPTPLSLPLNVERHDSKYGDWLGIAAAGVGGAVGAAGIEAYRHDLKQKGSTALEDQPGLQTVPTQVPAPAHEESGQPPVQGAIFAAFPPTSSGTSDTANQSTSPITGGTTDPASPIKDLASRPSLGRVTTISELHVPGEFPKGNSPMNSL